MIGKKVMIKFKNEKGGYQVETAIIEDKILVSGDTKYVYRYSNKFIRLGFPTEITEILS